MFRHKQGASLVWQGMVGSSELLGNTKWMLGNVRKFKFRANVWIDEVTLSMTSKAPLMPEDMNRKVAEYWIQDRGWDGKLMNRYCQ